MPWRFPSDVGGWLSELEGRTLAQLAEGRIVLELGPHIGRSTICLAQGAEEVWCVDAFDDNWLYKGSDGEERFRRFQNNLERYGLWSKIKCRRGRSCDVLCMLPPGRFDLIFHDCSHNYENVISDLRAGYRLMKSGGVWAVHDFQNGYPGVDRAIEECFDGNVEVIGSLAIINHSSYVRAGFPAGDAGVAR